MCLQKFSCFLVFIVMCSGQDITTGLFQNMRWSTCFADIFWCKASCSVPQEFVRNLTVSFPQNVVAMMGHLAAQSCRECFIDSCDSCVINSTWKIHITISYNFYISVPSFIVYLNNLNPCHLSPPVQWFPIPILQTCATEVTMTCIPWQMPCCRRVLRFLWVQQWRIFHMPLCTRNLGGKQLSRYVRGHV